MKSSSSSLKRKSGSGEPAAQKPDIATLESQIFESREHYNNIVTLLLLAKEETGSIKEETEQDGGPATVSLCRIFVRLIGLGALEKRKGAVDAEVVVVKWLKGRFQEYLTLMTESFSRRPSPATVAILMAIAKSEFQQAPTTAWRTGVFNRILEILVLADRPEFHDARLFFVTEYLEKFRDLTYYFFKSIRYA